MEDDATGIHYSRDRVHIKPTPGDASTPPTVNVSSERWEEGASVLVDMLSIKAMASLPKPESEIP